MALKIISVVVACLFTINIVAWANPDFSESTLAVKSLLTEESFKEQFKAREFLLAKEGAHEYIRTQVDNEMRIFGKGWKNHRSEIIDLDDLKTRGRIAYDVRGLHSAVIIRLAGLLASTGQYAYVELDGAEKEFKGMPTIYIDSMFANTPNEAIQKHEIDEILQWENLRVNILHIGTRREMGEWIVRNIDKLDPDDDISNQLLKGTKYAGCKSSREIAKLIHKDSFPLDFLYENEYVDDLDFDYGYIGTMLSLYGRDKESKQLNIAAHNMDMLPKEEALLSGCKIVTIAGTLSRNIGINTYMLTQIDALADQNRNLTQVVYYQASSPREKFKSQEFDNGSSVEFISYSDESDLQKKVFDSSMDDCSDADLVINHCPWDYTGRVAEKLSSTHDIPFIPYVHTDGVFSKDADYYSVLKEVLRRGEKHAIFVLHEEAKTNIHRDMGIAKDSMKVAGPVINQELFLETVDEEDLRSLRERWHISDDDVVLLFPNSISNVKNPIDLVYLLKELIEKHKLLNVKVVFVGQIMSSDLHLEFLRLFRKEGLEDNLVSVGPVKQWELLEWYNLCDMVISTSRTEGLSLIAAEAGLTGKTVAGYRISGLANPVKCNNTKDDTGKLVPYAEDRNQRVASLAEAVAELIKNPNLCERLGKNARNFIQTKYNLSNIIAHQEQMMAEAITKTATAVDGALSIWGALFPANEKQDKYYAVRYDSDRLGDHQNKDEFSAATAIEAYADLARAWSGNPESIKIYKNPSRNSTEKPLISVKCYSDPSRSEDSLIGEGQVNIEGDIEGQPLKITGMLNMAFAASNIPNDIADHDLTDGYRRLLSFIQGHFKDITGKELPSENMLKAIRSIKLDPITPIPVRRLEQYYLLTIRQLKQAA